MKTNTEARAYDFIVRPNKNAKFNISHRDSGKLYPTEYESGVEAQNAINAKFGIPLIPLPNEEVEEVVAHETTAFTPAEVVALASLLQATIEDRAFRPAARKANKELYQSILAQL